MKFFIAFLLILLIVPCSFSQNINRPDIICPSGLRVNSYTLALYYGRSDIKIPCRGMSVDIAFSYNNMRTAVDLGYGNGWSMSYSMVYIKDTNQVLIRQGNGRKDIFIKSGTGWKADEGSFDTLIMYQPGKFNLIAKGGMVFSFDDSTHRRVTKISDPNGNFIQLTYTDSLATVIADPAGRYIYLSYTNGHLTSISDPNFNSLRTYTYDYDSNWNMITYTDPLSNSIHYEYDGFRRIKKLTDQNSVEYQILYEQSGFPNKVAVVSSPLHTLNFYGNDFIGQTTVVEMVNNSEQTTYYNYGCGIIICDNLQEKSGNCCGFDESYQYNSNHDLIKKTDANLNIWQYKYDTKSNITEISDPLGNSEEYTYEPLLSKLTSKTDKNGNTTEYIYDSKGNLVQENKPLGISEYYSYDNYGNVISYTDGNGNTTNYNYNSYGYKTLVTYPDASTKSFTFDNAGNMISSTDANGNTTAYVYDALNREIQRINALNQSTSKTYDGLGNITSITDELGRITTFQYDALSRKIKSTTPAGTVNMTYDGRGNMLTKKDMNGNITYYSYDSHNNLISEKNALGHVKSFAYDNIGNKVTETDFSGNSKSYLYDAVNRVTQMTDALSHNTLYTYDANNNRTSITDANGNTTNSVFDELNRLIRTERPIGKTIMTYDANDNRTSITDAEGNVTTYGFNKMNRQYEIIDAFGNVAKKEYDNNGNLTKNTDRNGHNVTFGYDALNRKINEINSLGEITTINYNPVGNVSSRSQTNGNLISYTYDAANRLISISDLEGLLGTYSYDANSNRVSQTDGNGNTIIKKYDALNRLIKERDAMGRNTSYTYNNNSNIISIQDRNGKTTINTFDNLERKISVTTPTGNTTLTAYDNTGNIASLTDDNGNTTSYNYDANNRLINETYADGSTKSYSYDANGNIKSRKDNNGKVTDYKYDKLNRLLGRGGTSGADDFYNYDNENNMLNANNSNATITFTYNNANRLISETMNGKTTGYNYDIPGKKRIIYYPSGKVVSEIFDHRSRLTEINSNVSIQFSYDAGNSILTRNFSNGVNTNYTYNANYWITSVSHVKTPDLIAEFNYTFDYEGNRLTEKKAHNLTNSEKYTYDADNRLINYQEGTLVGNIVPSPITQTKFSYDGLGNRNYVVKDDDTTNYLHNNVNAYTDITDTVSVSPIHDANGNTINDGRHTYSFDYENRLISVDGGVSATFKYDALGRRIQKVTSEGSVNYFYDNQRVIEERDGSDALSASYIYGTWIDDILCMNRNGTDYFYHQNSLGSVAALTNSAGAVAERYEYDVYGNPSISFLSSASASKLTGTGNTYMFTGREFDKEIFNYHYRARFYNPDWGRFGQWDPLKYVDGMNSYEYVKSNSINLYDPLGLESCCVEEKKLFEEKNISAYDCVKDCVKNNIISDPVFLILNSALILGISMNPGKGSLAFLISEGFTVGEIIVTGTAVEIAIMTSAVIASYVVGYGLGTIANCTYQCNQSNCVKEGSITKIQIGPCAYVDSCQ